MVKIRQLFSTPFNQNVYFHNTLEETLLQSAFYEAEVGYCHLSEVAQQQVFQMIDQGDPNEQKC